MNSKIRRLTVFLTTGAVTLGTLAGCGSASGAAGTEAASASSKSGSVSAAGSTETVKAGAVSSSSGSEAVSSTSGEPQGVDTANVTYAASDADVDKYSSSLGQAENNDDARTIKVGTMSTIKGSSYIDDEGNLVGYEIDTLKAVDDLLPQYKFEFVQLDSTAIFSSLDANKIDLATGNYRRSAAREENHIHTYRSHFYTPYYIVTLADRDDLNSLDDFDGKSIGVSDGSLMADILEEYVQQGLNINEVYVTDAVSEMQAGRIDGTIWPLVAVDALKANYPDISFKVLPEPFNGTDECMSDANAYFYFRPEDEQLRNDVSEAVYQLRKTGKASEICKLYYGTDDPFITDIDTDAEKKEIQEYGITDAAE